MLTSLSIGRYPTQVPYDDAWSILSNVRQLLPNINSSHIKSGNVCILYLRMYLTIAADREDDITIARAFILFMMRHLWFQMANDTLPLRYLTIVADLDEAAQYDCGSTILAYLYHNLDTAVTTGGAITGFSQLLMYWFYEYCEVGHPIVKEDVKYLAYPRLRAWQRGNRKKTNVQADDVWAAMLLSRTRMPLQVPNGNSDLQAMRQAGFVGCEQFVVGEERETYASYWANQTAEVGTLLTYSQRMGNIDLFGPSVLRAGITPVVVTSTSVHSLSQDFNLPGKPEGPDLGWHMEWTGRRELLPIRHLRDPLEMSPSYGAEELWHLTHGMWRLCLAESAQNAQMIQDLTSEVATLRRHLDSIDDRLHAHDLHLRRGCDVRVVPLPPEGGARTRQYRSGPRTRGCGSGRSGPSQLI
ncbi:hypothetical protein GIB67_036864 [Kingdonia uniflora]|uniref:Aminotransferase-like plant mobile domain-containing protein n=1 Tax=Kingdonia uniflora TaxID=39325 RepID=A0A7J7LX18_9MAGN|nr:hypothetical protein GIB67_036864 [Kingdonia uniflora]